MLHHLQKKTHVFSDGRPTWHLESLGFVNTDDLRLPANCFWLEVVKWIKKSLAANRAKRKKDHCDLSGCSDDVTDERVTMPRRTGSPFLGVMHIRTPFKHRHAHALTFKIWPIWIKRQISGWKINTVHFISTTCPSVSAESHLCSIRDIALLLGLFIQPTHKGHSRLRISLMAFRPLQRRMLYLWTL